MWGYCCFVDRYLLDTTCTFLFFWSFICYGPGVLFLFSVLPQVVSVPQGELSVSIKSKSNNLDIFLLASGGGEGSVFVIRNG